MVHSFDKTHLTTTCVYELTSNNSFINSITFLSNNYQYRDLGDTSINEYLVSRDIMLSSVSPIPIEQGLSGPYEYALF